jgi:hypothetical protein
VSAHHRDLCAAGVTSLSNHDGGVGQVQTGDATVKVRVAVFFH